MKRVLIAFLAGAAVLALRPLSRLIGRTMSQHCAQMASKCTEVMSDDGASDKTRDAHGRFHPEAGQLLGDREPASRS